MAHERAEAVRMRIRGIIAPELSIVVARNIGAAFG